MATEQELILKAKSREELLTYIENMKIENSRLFNNLQIERDKLKREIRDLNLQVGALTIFKNSINKSLTKLQQDLER